MPVAAVQARESDSQRAEAGSLDGSGLHLRLDHGQALRCQPEDALGAARQLFESWLRTCIRTTLGRGPAAPGTPLPRAAILGTVEKGQSPSSSNKESRRLLRLLSDRLKHLDGLLRRSAAPGATPPELGALVLEGALTVLSAFAGLEAEQAALRASADPLTGLGGRRVMEDRLDQERSRTAREGRHCALALIDVDHFKKVNDSHGHAVGDQVLVGFAGILQESLRSYDGVYRYGGEEFVLCLPGVDLAVAHRMVERIRKTLSRTPFETSSGQPFFVSFSAGIAEISPHLATSRSLALADAALYRAKSAGRNRVFLSEQHAAA